MTFNMKLYFNRFILASVVGVVIMLSVLLDHEKAITYCSD